MGDFRPKISKHGFDFLTKSHINEWVGNQINSSFMYIGLYFRNIVIYQRKIGYLCIVSFITLGIIAENLDEEKIVGAVREKIGLGLVIE